MNDHLKLLFFIMPFEDENICFWEKGALADYINSDEFEYDGPNKDNILLENDDYSITTDNTSEIPSTPATTTNGTREFLFDHEAFHNAKEKASLNEYNDNEDDITWDDMDSVEKNSILTNSTTGSDIDKDYLINDTDIKNQDLVPCVLVDVFNGQIKRCPNYEKPGHPLRPLRQLIGTWEIDETVINQTNPESMLHTLGVCMAHLSFDQNRLHKKNSKKSRSVDESFICRRRCLFCHKDKYFFSRGKNCAEHLVNINDRNVQVPCVGLHICSSFKNDIIKEVDTNQNARYICSECFQTEGGHFFERKGSGSKTFSCHDEHIHDTTNALKLLGRWILDVANSNNDRMKDILLIEISRILGKIFKNIKQNSISINQVPPSLV